MVLNGRSREELHALLSGWVDTIPAEFVLIPLVDSSTAKRFLAKKWF